MPGAQHRAAAAASTSPSPLMHAVRQAVSEFSENTSIHGVRYIAEHGRRGVERLLWIVTEIVCGTGAAYMLMNVLTKFNENPTMTRVESYFHEVSDMPFPAITLCNVNRIFRSKAQAFVDSLKMPDGYPAARQDVMELLPLLGQLLSFAEFGSEHEGRERLVRILAYNNVSTDALLESLGQPCGDLIERCSWEGREVNCSRVFTRTMTYLGFCCSFNAARDFSCVPLPKRIDPNVKKEPLKTPFFGYPLGLTVLLNPRVDDYFWGPFASGGVVCAVHDANEMATEGTSQAMASIDKESMVQVLPTLRTASAALRDVTPERRRCLFDDENPLPDTAQYSADVCSLECEAGKIWRACGCRPVNFPRISGVRGRFCGLGKLACLAKYQEEKHNSMLKSQVPSDKLPSDPAPGKHISFLPQGRVKKSNSKAFTPPRALHATADALSEELYQACGCLAQCTSVDYDLETTTSNFGASRWVRRSFYKDVNATSRCLLHVFYDSQTVPKFINDLVSNNVQLMCRYREVCGR
ncbi:Pickpocket protein 28 [Frankliniella fusca]|uniref:Pickpocket protein 28 n=1 Tax=Frankliniella fusca TaxID=407009 RepID=A0AAE1LBK9_9NEOP|nr:Pickpocket protein 28 [Frankliniella fusca]